ncbi:hypothetical protein ACFL3S_04625 [Gemmatimonadota bacterium]
MGSILTEGRIFITDVDPKTVCEFYPEMMPKSGWQKLTYQAFPEGSCTDACTADMDNSSGPSVLLGTEKRASDNMTYIHLTLGTGCTWLDRRATSAERALRPLSLIP